MSDPPVRDLVVADLMAENAQLWKELRKARDLVAALVCAITRNRNLLRLAEGEPERRFPDEERAA